MTVRTAIVGAGWWSTRVHGPAIAGNPDAEPAIVCDADAGRARQLAETLGVPWTTTVEGVIAAGIDAAVVATPHHAHHAVAGPLLAAGVDVLVEKPMTLEPDQAWDLVHLATESGAKLHVGYSFLHAPHAGRFRDLLADGQLGDVAFFDGLFATAVQAFYRGDTSVQFAEGASVQSMASTYSDPQHGGGHLQAQTTHALAMALWCLQSAPKLVTADMSTFPNGAVDVSNAIALELENGTLVNIASTGMVPLHDLRIERYVAFGSAGHADLDTVAETLELHRPGQERLLVASGRDGSANPASAPVEDLVRCRLTDEEPVVPGWFGARVVEATWAAARSSERAVAVSVDAWRERSR